MPKTYTLETAAPFDVVRDITVGPLVERGFTVYLSEAEEPERVWNVWRWLAVIGALSGSPFFFRFVAPETTNLQGFGIGFIVSALVLLVARR